MPHRYAEQTARPRNAETQDARWPGIGINAVAAASICREHGDRRAERREVRPAQRYAEDYATD